MISPAEFVSQVKREMQKVVWPTGQETFGITVAVVVMAVAMMIYFFVSDYLITLVLSKIGILDF